MGRKKEGKVFVATHEQLEGDEFAVVKKGTDREGQYPVLYKGDNYKDDADAFITSGILHDRIRRGKGTILMFSRTSEMGRDIEGSDE